VASLLDRAGHHKPQPILHSTAQGKPRIQSALARSAVTADLHQQTMARLGLYAAQHHTGIHNLVTTPATLGLQ
jgi:hypothetical protein